MRELENPTVSASTQDRFIKNEMWINVFSSEATYRSERSTFNLLFRNQGDHKGSSGCGTQGSWRSGGYHSRNIRTNF